MKPDFFIYRKDWRNIGDLASCPKHYFSEFSGTHTISSTSYTLDIGESVAEDGQKNFVVGGGSLFGNYKKPYDWIDNLKFLAQGNNVLWGVGLGTVGYYPTWIDRYGLIGVREYDFDGLPWVPCASCMNSWIESFRAEEPIYGKVVYSHQSDILLKDTSFPQMSNLHPDIEGIFRFLSTGEEVITNTYHGAYWAALLNRKVTVVPREVHPYKYKYYRQPVEYATSIQQAQNLVHRSGTDPLFLAKCREANIDFKNKVVSHYGK
jgi:hypothetical protein